MNNIDKLLYGIIKKNGLRFTPERSNIFLCILKYDKERFSVDDILVDLEYKYCTATIYNVLDAFIKIGLLEKVPTPENKTIYQLRKYTIAEFISLFYENNPKTANE